MSPLMDAMIAMLRAEENSGRLAKEHQFIEILTFTEFDEIVAMLDKVLEDHWIEFPVWARNLAFRLACLHEPENPQIRRRAAADLRCFGPDWDLEADRLDREADEFEGK